MNRADRTLMLPSIVALIVLGVGGLHSAATAHEQAQPDLSSDQSCERPLLDFRVVTYDTSVRPVSDASGRPIWEPALALGSDGAPRHLTSNYLQPTATAIIDEAGLPAVAFELTDEGAVLFEELTRRIIGHFLGIFVEDELVAAPVVRAIIFRGGVIAGLSHDEAEHLAARLNTEATRCPRDE